MDQNTSTFAHSLRHVLRVLPSAFVEDFVRCGETQGAAVLPALASVTAVPRGRIMACGETLMRVQEADAPDWKDNKAFQLSFDSRLSGGVNSGATALLYPMRASYNSFSFSTASVFDNAGLVAANTSAGYFCSASVAAAR